MMKYDLFKHHRRSIRLPGYDYTRAGAYFVTICIKYGQCELGEVVGAEMVLSEWGEVAEAAWWQTAELRDHVALDTHQVMPNHFHALFWIIDTDVSEAPAEQPEPLGLGINVKPRSLGAIVRGFKSAVTNEINKRQGTPGTPFWQRNYYDQIIRDKAHLTAVRQYILNNPANWAADKLHPHTPPNQFNRGWPGKGKP